MDVVVYFAERLVDAPFQLHFDPSVLRYVDAAPGDFLAQGGSSVVFFSEGSARPGVVAVAIGRVERSTGSTGSGLLCRLRLQGVAAGSSRLVIAEPQAWDTAGERFAVLASGSVIDVR